MELELVEYKNELSTETQLRPVVEMPNKPILAEHYEKPKISEYTQQARMANTAIVLDKLMNLMAVNEKEGTEFHHLEAFNFINNKLTRFTYEEINEAFNMHVAGELGLPFYRELNAPTISKVMQQFEELRNQTLLSYFRIAEKNKTAEQILSPEEQREQDIESLKYVFMEWCETGDIPFGGYLVYKFLVDNKLLSPSPDYRKKVYAKAQTKLAKEAKQVSRTNSEYEKVLHEIEKNNYPRAIIMSKNLIISEYFTTFITKENKTPEDSFNQLLKKLNNE